MKPAALFVLFVLSAGLLAGCGASGSSCSTVNVLSASPAAATVSSTAKSPANQQRFTVTSSQVLAPNSSRACAISNVIAVIPSKWTNPDPIHISISSTNDSTNGLATCLGPTGGPVTLTVSGIAGSSSETTSSSPTSVQLTCQ